MGRVEVYLGLGSNLGDREGNLRRGLSTLTRRVRVIRVSSIYETEPWGYRNQPPFLNCTCLATTALSSKGLLKVLKDAEISVGREPTFPGGPRVFDADLLFYGQEVIEVIKEPSILVPHPKLTERAFVLVPLAEIAPQLTHPVLKQPIQELLERVEGRHGVKLWAPPPLSPYVKASAGVTGTGGSAAEG